MIEALDTGLAPVVAEQPPAPLATVSGAHLHGFPSRDSDAGLRGVHLLPAADLSGLRGPERGGPECGSSRGPGGFRPGPASREAGAPGRCAAG